MELYWFWLLWGKLALSQPCHVHFVFSYVISEKTKGAGMVNLPWRYKPTSADCGRGQLWRKGSSKKTVTPAAAETVEGKQWFSTQRTTGSAVTVGKGLLRLQWSGRRMLWRDTQRRKWIIGFEALCGSIWLPGTPGPQKYKAWVDIRAQCTHPNTGYSKEEASCISEVTVGYQSV